MDYTQIKRRYMRFLRLERNYTQNTIDAYSHDIDYLINFLNGEHLAIEEVRLSHLEQFATILHEFGVAPSSRQSSSAVSHRAHSAPPPPSHATAPCR